MGKGKGVHNQYYSTYSQIFVLVYFDQIWMSFNFVEEVEKIRGYYNEGQY